MSCFAERSAAHGYVPGMVTTMAAKKVVVSQNKVSPATTTTMPSDNVRPATPDSTPLDMADDTTVAIRASGSNWTIAMVTIASVEINGAPAL